MLASLLETVPELNQLANLTMAIPYNKYGTTLVEPWWCKCTRRQ